MSLKRFRPGSGNIITDPNTNLSGADTSIGHIGRRGRILYEAVVNNFFSNPEYDLQETPVNDSERTYRESMYSGVNTVLNPALIDDMPRCSVTATVVSDREAWGNNVPEIFFPLFPHITMPVKPGEKIWIIYETLVKSKSRRGYWISRISSNIKVDDPNYTHLDREFLYKQVAVESTSAMETSVGEATFEDEDVFSFPSGGGGDLNKNTMPGDDPYNDIVTTSASYISQFNGEPVPRFSPRVGDLVLEGSNNTLITLGQDRITEAGASDDDSGEKGIGTIDIVVGRGQEGSATAIIAEVELEARGDDLDAYSETNKFPQFNSLESNELEGNPDFDTDLSRLYVSMKTDGDTNFGLSFVSDGAGSVDEAPYIIARSTEIRLSARGSVRAIAESGAQLSLMDNGEVSLAGSRVFLGSPSETHGGSTHQHVVRGDLLADAFDTFFSDITEAMLATLGNFMVPVIDGGIATACSTLATNVRDSLSDVVHTE